MRYLTGFAELAPLYDGFIVDLWGVIHDGITPYPGALDCLGRLAGKRVLLLSNAPRRAAAAVQGLRTLGIQDALYGGILTSGEATWLALHDRSDPWFAALGSRVYHLGPARDRSVINGLNLIRVDRQDEAAFVLNTGPDDHRTGDKLDDFKAELDGCLRAGLKMICANPDLEIVRGGVRILCAGTLAAYYQAQGGDVRWIGKPDPAIYQRAFDMLGVAPGRVLAVGDSLRTDIAGAAGSGVDSAWILGGLHAETIGTDHGVAARAAAEAGLEPVAALPAFVW
jgi:HAD superfamily hydrolase (TIGR01459 family)